MNTANLRLHENDDPICATAIRSGPPPITPPALPLEQPRPYSAQWAAAGITVAIICLLVVDRLRTHSGTQPTAANTSPRRELNHVSRAELLQMPGVGPKLADALLAYREKIGRFKSIEELKDVPGIGKKKAHNLGRWLYVVSDVSADKMFATTVRKQADAVPQTKLINVNLASWEKLQKLDRVGPVIAQRIIDERAKSPFTSVEDMERVDGIGPKTVERLRPFVVVK